MTTLAWPSRLRFPTWFSMTLGLFMGLVISVPTGWADSADQIRTILDYESTAEGPALVTLPPERLIALLDYAVEHRLMIFELFNELALELEQRGRRIRIPGDSLRTAARDYDLGRERVAALLPVEKLAEVQLGAALGNSVAPLEVFLKSEHEQFLEIAEIQLATHYGFDSVGSAHFDEGFGARVKRVLFSFELEMIEIYEPGKIAIHVRGFSRPKRWKIRPIILIQD